MAIITEFGETPAFTISIEDLKQGSAYLCNNIKDAVFIGYNGPGVGSNIRAISICGKYAVGTSCVRYKFREVNLRVIVE